MSDKQNELDITSIDAREWAKEFVKYNSASDLDTMIAWFASAINAGYDEAKRRNGSSVEASKHEWCSVTSDNSLSCKKCGITNTNEQSDKCEREKFNNACGYTQVDWEADKNKLQWEFEIWNRALQNCAEECSKTERCELDRNKIVLKASDFFPKNNANVIPFINWVCQTFTAPNVKRLSVNDLRLFYANWTGKHKNCDDSKDFAKQLHQRIYEHKESLL